MSEEKVTKTTEETTTSPTVPVEKTTTEETVSVPEHEVTREAHRVSGQPDHVVKETIVTEEKLDGC